MDEDKFDMLLDPLDKLVFCLRFANLDTARKREIYQLTDGKKSIAEINKAINVKPNRMVPDLWADWTAKGIFIESPKVKGRKAEVIDLRELGL